MIDWLAEYGAYVMLIAFFAAFVGVAIWAYFPANRQKIEKYGDIPFKEAE